MWNLFIIFSLATCIFQLGENLLYLLTYKDETTLISFVELAGAAVTFVTLLHLL